MYQQMELPMDIVMRCIIVNRESEDYALHERLLLTDTRRYAVNILKMTEKSRNFVRGINDVITDNMQGHHMGAYAGYVDPELQNAQTEYWGSNYPKLQRIKKAIDPQVSYLITGPLAPFKRMS